jgi:hypothetical protein
VKRYGGKNDYSFNNDYTGLYVAVKLQTIFYYSISYSISRK